MPGGHQVAGGDFSAANPAVDGRGDAGETQVEAGIVQFSLGTRDRGLGFLGGAGAGIGQLGGNRVALAQTLAATGFALGSGLVGAGLLQLGFEAFDLGLERPRIDLEQQIAFLHQTAFVERHPVDKTGHPRANIHRLGRFQAAGELVPLVDRLFDHFGDADLSYRHLRSGFRGFAAGAENQHRCQRQGKVPKGFLRLIHVRFRHRKFEMGGVCGAGQAGTNRTLQK